MVQIIITEEQLKLIKENLRIDKNYKGQFSESNIDSSNTSTSIEIDPFAKFLRGLFTGQLNQMSEV
jgi:hypothetical protein